MDPGLGHDEAEEKCVAPLGLGNEGLDEEGQVQSVHNLVVVSLQDQGNQRTKISDKSTVNSKI